MSKKKNVTEVLCGHQLVYTDGRPFDFDRDKIVTNGLLFSNYFSSDW